MDSTVIAVLLPILVIQLLLIVWGLYDLTRPGRRVRGDSLALWAVVIVLVNLVGPVLYFAVGRKED